MAKYNPCCKYSLKNPPLPLYQGSSKTAPINIIEDIPLIPNFNNYPDVDNLSINTSNFQQSDLEFIKEIYDSIEGGAAAAVLVAFLLALPFGAGLPILATLGLTDNIPTNKLTQGEIDDALIKANYKLSPEFRCHMCRRENQFTTTSGAKSFLSFVEEFSEPKAKEYFYAILNCEEFGFNKAGGGINNVPADSFAGKLREGCKVEEKVEDLMKDSGNSSSFKNLCDIILAETIKSYLL